MNKQHEKLEDAQNFTLTLSTPEKYPLNVYVWYFLNPTKNKMKKKNKSIILFLSKTRFFFL